jgi:hypothetical protein
MSSRRNLTRLDGCEDAAIGFASMETITKSTTRFERRFKTGEEIRNLQRFDIDRDEILETRCVDENPSTRERMQRRSRGRVSTFPAAAIERRDPKVEIRNEEIQQRALADTRRTDESAQPPTPQDSRNHFDAFARRRRHTMDTAGSAINLAESIGQFTSPLEIDLVHDHNRLDSRRSCDDESSVDIARGLTRFGRHHDGQHVEIDGDRAFAATSITSPQDAVPGFDDQALTDHNYAIPRDCALIRREPDLALTPMIEPDEYGDTVVGDHSARLTIALVLRFGGTRRRIDAPRLSSATRRGPFS